MKRLFFAVAMLSTCSAVNAADFCRVVTYKTEASISAKDHSSDESSAGKRIYVSMGGNAFAIELDGNNNYGAVMSLGAIDGETVISHDDVNNSIFTFEPATRSYYEADTFTPDESQVDMGLKSSASIFRGTYKGCTAAEQAKALNAVSEAN